MDCLIRKSMIDDIEELRKLYLDLEEDGVRYQPEHSVIGERTEDFFQSVFKSDTSATMIGCYLGWAVFGIIMLIAVITGKTDLPRWACIFNIVPLFLVTFPFHIGGMGNWCGATMFAGLFVLMF